MTYNQEYDKDKYKTLADKIRNKLFNDLFLTTRGPLGGTVMSLPDEIQEEMLDTWLELVEQVIDEHTGTEPIPEEHQKPKYLRDY